METEKYYYFTIASAPSAAPLMAQNLDTEPAFIEPGYFSLISSVSR